ncbi:MAG: SRPBCC family protein [Sphingomonadaceae bacterium]|nr:SRPBCC family protein [Sphingomonadaceae bacterium]
MTGPNESSFAYVIYIRTTPERLWQALTNPDFTARYWSGVRAESDWTPGAPWRLVFADGRIADTGKILESDPPRRLAIRWRNEFREELKAEGFSRCIFEIEAEGDVAKLTVTHSMDRPDSPFVAAVSTGWPRILSNLKSLLETGEVIMSPSGS